jgi:hypothetical protein
VTRRAGTERPRPKARRAGSPRSSEGGAIASSKVAGFTTYATPEQSARWKSAAEAAGYTSVGDWLADAADSFLQARGRPLALYWRRGRFRVKLADGSTIEVRGSVSPPFAIFQGSEYGLNRNKPRSLVSLATGRVVATLRSARQARELAAELAPVWLRDSQAAASAVERHRRQ